MISCGFGLVFLAGVGVEMVWSALSTRALHSGRRGMAEETAYGAFGSSSRPWFST